MEKINKKPKVLIAAGGTGGHVFPGIAVAKQLQAQGVDVVWLGSEERMESKHVRLNDIPFKAITITGLRGRGRKQLLLFPIQMFRALWQTYCIFRETQPTVVLGMGGFVSGPAGLISKLLGIPLLIHEQNAIPGMTNRYLGKLANRILESFPGTFAKARHVIYTGNPIRSNIATLARLRTPSHPLQLLVLGGSQGAHAINLVIPHAIAQLSLEERPNVWHQTGERDRDMVQAAYAAAGIPARVDAFINTMNEAYDFADVVVSRAGATTLAELATVGVPSILIPFPQAVDDHQTHNAQQLVAHGTAICVAERDFTPERFALLWRELTHAPDKLSAMSQPKALDIHQHAASKIAALCLEVGNE